MTGPKASLIRAVSRILATARATARSSNAAWRPISPRTIERISDSILDLIFVSAINSVHHRVWRAEWRQKGASAAPLLVVPSACIGVTENLGGTVMSKNKSPRHAVEQQTADIS